MAGGLTGRQLWMVGNPWLVALYPIDRLATLAALCRVRLREEATAGGIEQLGR
jgi:hypothetical protein